MIPDIIADILYIAKLTRDKQKGNRLHGAVIRYVFVSLVSCTHNQRYIISNVL